jgi:DNA topoisomerase VI subunit B
VSTSGNGKIQKIAFDTPLSVDYFYPNKLQTHTGRPVHDFPAVILKELCDNAIDACEAAGVAPEIGIRVGYSGDKLHVSVNDNGAGIPSDLVARVIDYNTHTSDKALYRTPSRGQQGNALKTIVAMPFALGDPDPLVTIRGQSVEHRIRAALDASDYPEIARESVPCENGTGTRVSVGVPVKRSHTHRLLKLARGYHLFNPHAKVTFCASSLASNHW